MYCSSCGSAVARDLVYCNHCGAKVGGASSVASARKETTFPELLICAMVVVFGVGLGGTIGLMAVMKDVFGSSRIGLIMAFSFLTLFMTLVLEGVLVGLLMSGKRGRREVSDKARPREHTTNDLSTAEPRVLPEHMPSVTEHTTRAFEPVHRKQSVE